MREKSFLSEWWFQTCRRLLLRTFRPMQAGSLVLIDSWGERYEMGIPGAEPRAEIHVKHPQFFARCVLYGDVGFAESYVDGEWETPNVTAIVSWFCANAANAPTLSGSKSKRRSLNLLGVWNRWLHFWRRNSLRNSKENIHAHYDLGNRFYRLWLDPTMTYSSALFESPDQELSEAQNAKYERLCQLLQLKPGEHLLEIGSGWGGMVCYAARKFGVKVTTITLSQEQHRYCAERFKKEGVNAEILLKDYREVTGQFDKIVSIEMLEAVGDRYLETYFSQIHRLLKPQGLFAAQFITCPDRRYADLRQGVDWIQKHIFPGSLLLSMNRVGEAVEKSSDLWLHDLRDLGRDYTWTLQHWHQRFNSQLDAVRDQGFDDRFIRAWNYYLCYCEAAFAMRHISVVQALWTRPNNVSMTSLDPEK